jgi:hypothetical protein
MSTRLQGKKLRHKILLASICHPTERHASKIFKTRQTWNIMKYHGISWNIPTIFPFKPSFLHLPNGDFPRMTPGFARGETKPPNSPGRGPLDASLDLVVKLLQQEYIYI